MGEHPGTTPKGDLHHRENAAEDAARLPSTIQNGGRTAFSARTQQHQPGRGALPGRNHFPTKLAPQKGGCPQPRAESQTAREADTETTGDDTPANASP